MPEVAVVDTQGREVDRLVLPEEIFGVEIRPDLLHQAVVTQLANRRAGTVSTKRRSEVRGGGAKPWRQKGTGRARHGSRRSPLWRGGGVSWGPKPRSFRKKLPRKVRRWALRSAWSDKVADQALIVVDRLELPNLKTQVADEVLGRLTGNLSAAGKILIMLEREEMEVARAFRNLPGVTICCAPYASVYELLWHEAVILTRKAVQRLVEELLR